MKIKIKLRSSSAEIVASIDDLLSEILLRLPLKSLLCFKAVSKHWHFLITNPSFSLRRNPSPNPAVGLFLHQSLCCVKMEHKFEYFSFSTNKHFPPYPELNFTADPGAIAIKQSSNGLLLCCSYLNTVRYMNCYIYNPTTKRFLQLPTFEVRFPNIQGMNLAFDPAKSPHYKVVCVFLGSSNAFEFAIYSSKTGYWRKCTEPFKSEGSLHHQVFFKKGVYWNGAIHWIGRRSDTSFYLKLDDDEMPRKLRMPPISSGRDRRFQYYFGESLDHLHYIEFFEVKIVYNVYEMKRDYSEWFVKYRVDLRQVVATYPVIYMDDFDPRMHYPYGFSIFTLVRGVKDEDSFLVLHIPGEVVKYNLVNGSFETIYEFQGREIDAVKGSLRYEYTNGYQYIESLSCVDPDPLPF